MRGISLIRDGMTRQTRQARAKTDFMSGHLARLGPSAGA